MKLSESELIARKSEFAVPTARELAWDLPGEKNAFRTRAKPRSARSLPLVQAGSVSPSASNPLNQTSDLRIHEDSQCLIGSERWCVLSFE